MLKIVITLLALVTLSVPVAARDWPNVEGDTVVRDFRFADGKVLPEVRLHYTTLGTPRRDAKGQIVNAVMVLHGTGGSGRQFLVPQFADELYGPGAPLDITQHFVILPDSIGHGKSAKPSDGLRAAFPAYDYDDMIRGQKAVLDALGVKRLQLILGTSMGCMHIFVFAQTYPGMAERLAPFACNAREIAGRNRFWRKASIDAIRADPAWQGGNYTVQPAAGLRTAGILSVMAGANPVALQAAFPTRATAEAALDAAMARRMTGVDANDMIYQLDSSRSYNPLSGLAKITVPVLWINSADDFINPPELGMAEVDAKLMPRARFVMIPISADTKGHGTHTWAKFWKGDLVRLMGELPPSP